MGLLAVAAGTAWAAGGVPALRTAAVTALRLVPALMVATGVLIVLRCVVPRGALAGPLILIIGGSLAMAFQFDLVTATMLHGIGPAALVSGGVIIAMSSRSREDPMAAIVRRYWSVFLPRTPHLQGEAPHKFIVRCLFGELVLDLTTVTYPSVYRITIDLTVLAGWVEIRVPADWKVQPGRLYLTQGTRFEGELSSSGPVTDEAEPDEFGQNWVVLNVQGWLGRVRISRGHSVESGGSPAPPSH